MTRTLSILWVLFKKNTPRHALITNTVVLVISALVAGFEHPQTADHPGLWLAALGWLTLLGMSAGPAAFTADLTRNGLRFLEYLPVRRWHIWAADYADGLFWPVLFAVVTTWRRTLSWAPPPAHADDLTLSLFPHRWTLLAGSLCLMFCAFSVGTFFRLAVDRDVAALFRTAIGTVTTVMLVLFLPSAALITPTLTDLCLPLLVIGLFYSAAGAFVFLAVPRDWGRWRRAFLVTWPLTIVLSLVAVVVVANCCRLWSRFDPADVDSVVPAYAAADDDDDAAPATHDLLLNVHTRRSGHHLLRLDLSTGRYVDIGRGLDVVPRPYPGHPADVGPDHRLLVTSLLSPVGTLPFGGGRGARTLLLSPDGTTGRDLFPGNVIHCDGLDFTPTTPRFTTDGRLCVVPAFRGEPTITDTAVFLADPTGRVLRRIPAARDSVLAFDPDTARLLVRSPDDPDAYALHDLAAGTHATLRLPGEPLDCSPDLTTAVCLRRDWQNDTARQTLLLVDLKTLAAQTVLTPDDLPTAKREPADRYAIPHFLNGAAPFDVSVDSVSILLDTAHRRAIWYDDRYRNRSSKDPAGVLCSDLRTGRRTTLLTPADIETLSPPDYAPSVSLTGLTPDGSALLAQFSDHLDRIPLDRPAARVTLARRPDGAESASFTLSPDRRHIVCTSGARHGDEYQTTYDLWTPDQSPTPTRLTLPRDVRRLTFYGNDHLLLSAAGTLSLLPIPTLTPQQLFPPK